MTISDRKIFAGPRLRRIRNGLGLTQTAMAESLAISPSYLNLIERNQRPLTVQLLLKLSSVHKVDLEELQGEDAGNLGKLREVFKDPLLAGELPGDQELVEIADAAPNAAGGIVKLYKAYREQASRLTDLAQILAKEGHAPWLAGARLPIDEVRDMMEVRPNFHVRIEDAVEAFHQKLQAGDDLAHALKQWLRTDCGIAVRVLPVHVMPDFRRRFDRHSMRLFLSERLSAADQAHEIAAEIATIALREEISVEVDAMRLSSPEAARIARFELARYGAHALLMPYAAFLNAAQRLRYDVELLRSRFGTSYGHIAYRLTTLQRPGAAAIPFFMMEIDAAGNRLRRAGAQGFPQARFGGLCPKLGIHAAVAQPGQILADVVEMPQRDRFLTISRTVEGPHAGYGERIRRTAILLGCDLQFSNETIYGQGEGRDLPTAVEIGPSCRLCERKACLSRAEPPVTRPLGLDEMVTGLSAFEFQ